MQPGALCPQWLLADCPERKQRGADGEHPAGDRALLIAPALGITHRFIGSEPFCDITRQYNQTLHDLLASHIEVVEMPRIKATGNAISASEVRRLLKTQQFSRIREIVPDSTFTHLETHYRASAEVA